jgi:hypothetical protein
MFKRVALVTAGLLAAWIVVLVILGAVLGERQAKGTAARLGESLQADATVGESELALVRGRLQLGKVSVKRDDVVGHLALDVAEVRCDLGPLGWALVDSSCQELRITGTRLEVSTVALFKIKNPKRAPVHARRVVIDDAVLAFAPSAFVPSLGRIEIKIDHAEAGDTLLRTPLSWIFTLEELRAHLELPAGVTVRLAYADGVLSVAGSVFGSSPVELPVTLPAATLAHDAHDEIELLVQTGKDIAGKLVAKRATDWIEQKLR